MTVVKLMQILVMVSRMRKAKLNKTRDFKKETKLTDAIYNMFSSFIVGECILLCMHQISNHALGTDVFTTL
jgi:hypothetical protein